MLNDILNLLVKLLNEGAGPKIKETIGAVAAGAELPYGTAIAELVKQQNLIGEGDLEKILAFVAALLGVEAADKKPLPARCEDCPYACGQVAELAPASSEGTPLDFDLDRAPVTKPLLLAPPDAEAAAEAAMEARIRALSAEAV